MFCLREKTYFSYSAFSLFMFQFQIANTSFVPMNYFKLSSAKLSLQLEELLPVDASCGAQVLFVGTVRNYTKEKKVIALEFEAYEPMVYSELEKIATEIKIKWQINDILLHHRTGRCEVGEVPVIAAVTATHRTEAFEACAYLMNRLKQTVPIWKKEMFENGEQWVTQYP